MEASAKGDTYNSCSLRGRDATAPSWKPFRLVSFTSRLGSMAAHAAFAVPRVSLWKEKQPGDDAVLKLDTKAYSNLLPPQRLQKGGRFQQVLM